MKTRIIALVALLNAACSASLLAQSPRTLSRIVWQDAAEQKLKWGDIKKGKDWSLIPEDIMGQPKLDPEKQKFVQMQSVDQLALAGIRDNEDGAFQSGWLAFRSGVTQQAHGDHFHWHYGAAPQTITKILDEHQGNPAHVYLYDNQFYIANDKKNGFTLVTPAMVGKPNSQPDRFYEAGGGHITMAAIQGKVAYSTWIDREGENKGRVDVVGLGSNSSRGYHFHLPSGGIHGAITSSGKVFFAPSDGICWVAADMGVSSSAEEVTVHHLSLGENEDGTPLRTGAFHNFGKLVLFTVRSASPELCMVDASSPKPTIARIVIPVASGNSLTTPKTIRSWTGERYAILFEESREGDKDERLHVVALDPNRDGKLSDAKLHKSIPVGKSLIEGHSGHHECVALSNRLVAVSNPGDGTITIFSTSNWENQATLKVGGIPTRMITFGGK